MDGLGIKLLGGPPDEFGRRIRSEMDRWGAVLRNAGIKLGDGRQAAIPARRRRETSRRL